MTQTQTKTKNIDVTQVAENVDIVELVLDYGIDLIQQTNGEYICVCPFHDDVNPSMRVYPNTGTFHCFGCGAGHSVFEFVMRMENIEFKDALYLLAEKVGYSNTFVLCDIKIRQTDENFTIQREKIEDSLHKKTKKVYEDLYNSGIISKQKLYESFEGLWKWYDKQQYLFDKNLFQGGNVENLTLMLYKFYEAFLRKLYKLEQIIVQGENECQKM